MAQAREEQLLALLTTAGTWVSAAALSDALGVSTRSVRGYVQRLRDRDGHHIQSGSGGYRLRAVATVSSPSGPTPEQRTTRLLRELLREAGGIDVDARALSEHLSGSTMESDLARLRHRLEHTGLRLERDGARVRLRGPEEEQRRVLLELFRAESTSDSAPLSSALGSVDRASLGRIKTTILAGIASEPHRVNEYGLDDFLLHLAVAVDRARGQLSSTSPAETQPSGVPVGTDSFSVAELISRELGVQLPAADITHLTRVLSTRAVTADHPDPA
ncbi:MAG: HTH domain-containing protein, partial [Mycetocola sp.]